AAHFGDRPSFAYFDGCGTGGRQGLAEARKYPDDFDGIISGSPSYDVAHQAFAHVWLAQSLRDGGTFVIPEAKLQRVHDAVLAACDALDGVTDGVLDNP